MIRADELAAKLGLAETRSQAQELIRLQRILLPDGSVLAKPGKKLPPDTILQLAPNAPKAWVARSAEKLDAFLNTYQHDCNPAGLDCLDIGASTGGFTQRLLEGGAGHVTCVDVGHGQLHQSLLADERVLNLEGLNARYLQADALPLSSYGAVVVDVSFISLRTILPPVWHFLERGGWMVTLVKPQFEMPAKEGAKSKGVVRDPKRRKELAEGIRDFALGELEGAELIALMDSPIAGHSGNHEFLLGLRRY